MPRLPRKWRRLIKSASRGASIPDGGVIRPAPGARWSAAEPQPDSGLLQRHLDIRVYVEDTDFGFPPCGVQDSRAACEPAGSRVATGFNVASYRLAEARRLLEGEQMNACRVAAWAAYVFSSDVNATRASLKDAGDWVADKQYVTRDAGTKSEEELFAEIGAIAEEAAQRFQQCGGEAAPPQDGQEDGAVLAWAVSDRMNWQCADVTDGQATDPDSGLHCGAHRSCATGGNSHHICADAGSGE